MKTISTFSLLESLLWTPKEGYFLLDYHFHRLSASAKYFSFPYDQDLVQAELDQLASGLAPEAHKVRLLLARDKSITCQATPMSDIPKPNPSRLMLAPEPVDLQNIFLYHKTTHRDVYRWAEEACPECDEIILWNERGEVTETTSANLAFELNGELVTPPISCGLLGGTYRAWMLGQKSVKEKIVRVDDLPNCTKILVINSVRPPREGLLLSQITAPFGLLPV
jgi:branched-subunit amino acid aminotransferase/4-amino-4-deoxychorismate lyase